MAVITRQFTMLLVTQMAHSVIHQNEKKKILVISSVIEQWGEKDRGNTIGKLTSMRKNRMRTQKDKIVAVLMMKRRNSV